VTARGLAGARVSVPVRKLGEEEGIEILGLIHGGGSLFIDALGRRLSSSTSRRRRRIGRCLALHRAVCLLEVEDDDGSKRYRGCGARYWAGLTGYDGWAAARLVFLSFFLLYFFYFISCFLFCYF
jgi:hypothetical protein